MVFASSAKRNAPSTAISVAAFSPTSRPVQATMRTRMTAPRSASHSRCQRMKSTGTRSAGQENPSFTKTKRSGWSEPSGGAWTV
jgi:hypothetical protein